MTDPFFIPITIPVSIPIPQSLQLMQGTEPDPICAIAAEHLQTYLSNQHDFLHNFGLSNDTTGPIIGKMFGVLVVENGIGQTGYLAGFSGKLAGKNHHQHFVPPVFDSLAEHSFLNNGMKELTRISSLIREHNVGTEEEAALRQSRRSLSVSLQQQLFDSYTFRNRAGDERSLNEIFRDAAYKNPPSGAGECAGPKLLQYAFRNDMKPLALTEFWWGESTRSSFWKHGQYYACCKEKCEPILAFMLA